MGPAAHRALGRALARSAGRGENQRVRTRGGLQLVISPMAASVVMASLPPPWRGVAVEAFPSAFADLPGSLRLTSSAVSSPRWRLELHAPGEGVLRAEVRIRG